MFSEKCFFSKKTFNFMIIPRKIFGLICGSTKPFILKKKKKFFLILAVHSSINLFNCMGLVLKTKSPFLHPTNYIISLLCFKNRIIILINKNIHILDYFIPTSRIFFLEKKINSLFFLGKFFLTLEKKKKKIAIFDPWKMNVKIEIEFKKEILAIKTQLSKKKKQLTFILKKNSEIEAWDLENVKCLLKINLKLKFFIFNFDFNKTTNKFILFLSKNYLLVFDIKKKKIKIYFIGIKKEKIKNIIFSYNFKKLIFLFGENSNFIWNKKKKNKIKFNFWVHIGKINPIGFFEETNIFLTLGIFDNTISIFRFSKKKLKFKLLKIKRENYLPIEKIKIVRLENFSLIFANVKGFLGFYKNKKLLQWEKNNYLKKNFLKRKKIIRHLYIEKEFIEKRDILVIIGFYKFQYPFLWKISENIVFPFLTKALYVNPFFKNINSLIFLSNYNFLLIGFEKNIICLLKIHNANIEHSFLNHHHFKKKNNCFVRTLNKNHDENLFISGCSHGTLKLWDVKDLKTKKKIKLKNKIIKTKWFLESDTIIVLCNNNHFYIIFPENFIVQRVLFAHKKLITDFFLIDSSKVLISSSLDKTIKIWNLFTASCLDSILMKFPIIEMDLCFKENNFITVHHNTLGIGFWKNEIKIEIKNSKNNYVKKNFFITEINSLVLNKIGKFFIKKKRKFSDPNKNYFMLEKNSTVRKLSSFENIPNFSKNKKIKNKKEIIKIIKKIIRNRNYFLKIIFLNGIKSFLENIKIITKFKKNGLIIYLFFGEILFENFLSFWNIDFSFKFFYNFFQTLKKKLNICYFKNFFSRLFIETNRVKKKLEWLN
jgi:WD40 repeat protein